MTALRAGSFAATAEPTNLETVILCNHGCQNLQDVLRHRVVVDSNESFWFRIDFEAFIET